MWKTDTQLYKETVTARALHYIAHFDGTSITEYLEFNTGPLLAAFMVKYSPSQVSNDLELEIRNLR
jgi:hypothetical protein